MEMNYHWNMKAWESKWRTVQNMEGILKAIVKWEDVYASRRPITKPANMT